MVEYLDWVDANNKRLGEETRAKIHSSGLWHRGVHVLVFNSESCLILQMRSSSKDKFPNRYDCSVSEHLKTRETYNAAAIRGLKEELGISDVKLKKLIRFKMNYGLNDNMISELFECYYDDLIRIEKDEIQSLINFSLNDVKNMLTTDEIKFARWTSEILKWYLKLPSKVELLSTR